MAAVNDIILGTALAAVRRSNSIRVYKTDANGGVREVQYEGRWMGGEPRNTVATGKIGTPLSATNNGFDNIRVYYVTQDNTLGEAAYDANTGWYNGLLTAKNYEVAPYSSVAGIFLGGQTILRVFCQIPDNTIQEYVWDGASTGWTVGSNYGPALPGTQIAATTWGSNPWHLRLYFQLEDNTVVEKCWDGEGWNPGQLCFNTGVPRSALGVTSWGVDGASLGIRLYYGASGDVIREKAWDGQGGWYEGGFSQQCMPGSNVAAVPLDILRVYLQNGTRGTAVTEFKWAGGWDIGFAALPPA
ncbi:fungal fucose-specific lectin [Parathielavia hyrcaniae]|uniref:Fungal fucose-specific lectin n=1 Tax=Parathielavia hyrcaniae TaxID=113614 RepID=A0AAN6PRH4_9PEZI|nr:fungal fucose-specific lectin [Parathielavia hyrcaniae]